MQPFICMAAEAVVLESAHPGRDSLSASVRLFPVVPDPDVHH